MAGRLVLVQEIGVQIPVRQPREENTLCLKNNKCNVKMYYLYILKNKTGYLYTGVPKSQNDQLDLHNLNKGAGFTADHKPF